MIALAVVAALVFVHVAWWAGVRARWPATGARVSAAGARLHVIARGSGPPVVLVHGSNGVATDFPDALLDDLARDHTVLALDRPGHGHSTRGVGALDLAANARAVLALIAARTDEPALLVGHSYGCAVALRAALDEPARVRGVVAVTPAVAPQPRDARATRLGALLPLLAPLAWVLTLPVGLAVSPRIRRAAWHPAPPPREWNASRAFSLCPDQVLHAGENARHLASDLAALTRDLPALRVPLIVLAGAEDRITPPAHHVPLLAALPGARVRTTAGVGHWLPRVRPETVRAAVRELAREPGAPRG